MNASHVVTPELINAILDGYTLHPHGVHGVGHWARVLENGTRLAETNGGSVEVVHLFAVFHDSRRLWDGDDPGHGARGAELALELHGEHFQLSEPDLLRLSIACELHTDQRHHDDPTVQCCFDADRLDLGRVGVWPDPRYLNTDAAKDPKTIQWALQRSWDEVVPDFVSNHWGVDVLED